MGTKTKIAVVVLALVASAAIGRYTAPAKVEVKTETVEKIVYVKVEDTHKDTTTTTTKTPDGTETTVTKTTEDTKSTTKEKDKTTEVASTTTTYVSNKNNISILAGLQPKLSGGISAGPVVYGASITHALIGPITVGAWGMSNLTIGASIGLNF